ncbi:MAG: hypothetical protein AAGH38_04800 [Pseudomonadota bacterium]
MLSPKEVAKPRNIRRLVLNARQVAVFAAYISSRALHLVQCGSTIEQEQKMERVFSSLVTVTVLVASVTPAAYAFLTMA